jgi:hypothetical protein
MYLSWNIIHIKFPWLAKKMNETNPGIWMAKRIDMLTACIYVEMDYH